jgi:hypothetical protein
LLDGFDNDAFREACRHVVGEASAIFAAQKGRFVFWLSVGDCLGFALHPELGGQGQFAMNQRHFYEWIGKSNVFELGHKVSGRVMPAWAVKTTARPVFLSVLPST